MTYEATYPQDPLKHGLQAVASTTIQRVVLSFSYTLNLVPGIAIICGIDSIQGVYAAPSSHEEIQHHYTGALSIPLLFSVIELGEPVIVSHGVAQAPPVRLGFPQYESDRFPNGERRLLVSLHKGIGNTREYDLTSPIVHSSSFPPPSTPNAGIVLDQLQEIPTLTPFALRIHIPFFGLELKKPNLEEEELVNQAGTYRMGLTYIFIESTSLVTFLSEGEYSASQAYSTLLISSPDGNIRRIMLSMFLQETGQIGLYPIEPGSGLTIESSDSVTFVIRDLFLMTKQEKKPELLFNRLLLLSHGYAYPISATLGTTLVPTVVSPNFSLPSLAEDSTFLNILTPNQDKNPGVAGSIAPLHFSTALPAVFHSYFPGGFGSKRPEILLLLPIPVGVEVDFSRLGFYGSPEPWVYCTVFRHTASMPSRLESSENTRFYFISTDHEYTPAGVKILLPQMTSLPQPSEPPVAGVSYSIQCLVYALFTKAYTAQTTLGISFITPSDDALKNKGFDILFTTGTHFDLHTQLPTLTLPAIKSSSITSTVDISPAQVGAQMTLKLEIPHLSIFVFPEDILELAFPATHFPIPTTSSSLDCHLTRPKMVGTLAYGLSGLTVLPETQLSARGVIKQSLAGKPTTLTLTIRDSTGMMPHLATMPYSFFDESEMNATIPPLLVTCSGIVYTHGSPSDSTSSLSLRTPRRNIYDYLRPSTEPFFILSKNIIFPIITGATFTNPWLVFSRILTFETAITSSPTIDELGSLKIGFEKLNFPFYTREKKGKSTLALRLEMPIGFRTLFYSSLISSSDLCEVHLSEFSSKGVIPRFPVHVVVSSPRPLAPLPQHTLTLDFSKVDDSYHTFIDPNDVSQGYFFQNVVVECGGFGLPLSGPARTAFTLSAISSSQPSAMALATIGIDLDSKHAVTMGNGAITSATATFTPPIAASLVSLLLTLAPVRVSGQFFSLRIELPRGTNEPISGQPPIHTGAFVEVTISAVLSSTGLEVILSQTSSPILLLAQHPTLFTYAATEQVPNKDEVFEVPIIGLEIPFRTNDILINGLSLTLGPADSLRVRVGGLRSPSVAFNAGERPLRAEIRLFEASGRPQPNFSAVRGRFFFAALEDGKGRMALQRLVVDPSRGHFGVFASPIDIDGREGFPLSGGRLSVSLPFAIPFVNANMIQCTIDHHLSGIYQTNSQANGISIPSIYLTSFSEEIPDETSNSDANAAQGNRHKLIFTLSSTIATQLSQRPYLGGVEIQCIGATPVQLELSSDASYYIEIFRQENNPNPLVPSYRSIGSTGTALLTSARAPILASRISFSQSSVFAGALGSLEFSLENLLFDVRVNDVIELAFPHASDYRFDMAKCLMTRLRQNEVDNHSIDEISRTSFSSTSLFRATFAAQIEESTDGQEKIRRPPRIVSFRFTTTQKDPTNSHEEMDDIDDMVVLLQGEGLRWKCSGVLFPSIIPVFALNPSQVVSTPHLEVSLYRSLSQPVLSFTKPLDTLLVRMAFNDDVELPLMKPQEMRSVTFYSTHPYTGATSDIGVELVLTDSIALTSQERTASLRVELPPGWSTTSTSRYTMSIGSPYIEDADIEGEVVITRKLLRESLQFTFFPPKGVLRDTEALYLFCSNILMPVYQDSFPSMLLNDKEVLTYEVIPSSITLVQDEQIQIILAQASSALSPRIVASEVPEYSSVLSLTQSFVSVRPFLESEIEDWRATLATAYKLRVNSNYGPSGGSNGVVGIRLLSQHRIPKIVESRKNNTELPSTIFGIRNYVPTFHYQVELTAEIQAPQPWFPVEEIYQFISSPSVAAAANLTFTNRYNLASFKTVITPTLIPTTCFDRLLSADETDLDCGGDFCFKCHVGKSCLKTTDCVSGVCGPSGVCLDIYSTAHRAPSSLFFSLFLSILFYTLIF